MKSNFKLFIECFLREGQVWEATNGLAFDLFLLTYVHSSLLEDFVKWQIQEWWTEQETPRTPEEVYQFLPKKNKKKN